MRSKLALMMVILVAASMAFAIDTHAQGRVNRRGGQGWGSSSQYGRIYDATTVETVEGDVVAVERFDLGPEMAPGVHLLLRTGDEEISIHLGPAWYIDNLEGQIEAGDAVRVEGSRVNFDGADVLIAARVTRGESTLALRDQNGVPVWSGWGGRGVRGRRRP